MYTLLKINIVYMSPSKVFLILENWVDCPMIAHQILSCKKIWCFHIWFPINWIRENEWIKDQVLRPFVDIKQQYEFFWFSGTGKPICQVYSSFFWGINPIYPVVGLIYISSIVSGATSSEGKGRRQSESESPRSPGACWWVSSSMDFWAWEIWRFEH